MPQILRKSSRIRSRPQTRGLPISWSAGIVPVKTADARLRHAPDAREDRMSAIIYGVFDSFARFFGDMFKGAAKGKGKKKEKKKGSRKGVKKKKKKKA